MIAYILGAVVALLLGVITVWLEPRLKRYKVAVILVTVALALLAAYLSQPASPAPLKGNDPTPVVPTPVPQTVDTAGPSVAVDTSMGDGTTIQPVEVEKAPPPLPYKKMGNEHTLLWQKGAAASEGAAAFNNNISLAIETLCRKKARGYPTAFVFRENLSAAYIRQLKNFYEIPFEVDVVAMVISHSFPILVVCSDGIRLYNNKAGNDGQFTVRAIGWADLKGAPDLYRPNVAFS
jgi:hypothetical protein